MLAESEGRRLRHCLGQFATGITIVTYRSEQGLHGVTVNAFTSVSLNPPLILVSIDRGTVASRLLEENNFTVNLIGTDQEDMVWQFAGKPQENANVAWEEGEYAPRLEGGVGWIECSPWRSYDGGDHVLYLGEVQNLEIRDGDPLLFFKGKLRHVGEGIDGIPWIDSMDSPAGITWVENPLKPKPEGKPGW
jgi:flavin reductase (DIM6/NTAB) family NADH-FMN oxidoreductase RutF